MRLCPICSVLVVGRKDKLFCSDSCQSKARWAKNKRLYHSDPQFRAENLARVHRWVVANREKKRARSRKNHKMLRLAVLAAYGGLQCTCCGETAIEFLTLDHVNNDGATQRKSGFAAGGAGFYRRLQKAGYPPGYQVLCYNCNCAKGFYGICPHQAPK